MTHLLTGAMGLGLLLAVAVLASVLDVGEEISSPSARGGKGAVPRTRRLLTAGTIVLVILAVAALVATGVRIFVVVR